MTKVQRIFAYGTLQTFSEHPLALKMKEMAQEIKAAQVRGNLYKVDYYPGLVLDSTGDWVLGQLFYFKEDDFSKLVEELDRYEGCHAMDSTPHEYKRIQYGITLTSSMQKEISWVYEYISETKNLPKIDKFY